jgi:hypothetical protein
MRSLEDVIAAYSTDEPRGLGYRRALRGKLHEYELQTSIYAAIDMAIDTNPPHPHQRRLPHAKLKEAGRNLRAHATQCEDAATFKDIHEVVSQCVRPPFKNAPLLVYDVALRLGAYRRLRPREVYLHAGTQQGAQAVLGERGLALRVQPAEFPAAFSVLEAQEIEDCLCRCKEKLLQLRREGVIG